MVIEFQFLIYIQAKKFSTLCLVYGFVSELNGRLCYFVSVRENYEFSFIDIDPEFISAYPMINIFNSELNIRLAVCKSIGRY